MINNYREQYESTIKQAVNTLRHITGVSQYKKVREEFGRRMFNMEENMKRENIPHGNVIYSDSALRLKLELFGLDVDMNMKAWRVAA